MFYQLVPLCVLVDYGFLRRDNARLPEPHQREPEAAASDSAATAATGAALDDRRVRPGREGQLRREPAHLVEAHALTTRYPLRTIHHRSHEPHLFSDSESFMCIVETLK